MNPIWKWNKSHLKIRSIPFEYEINPIWQWGENLSGNGAKSFFAKSEFVENFGPVLMVIEAFIIPCAVQKVASPAPVKNCYAVWTPDFNQATARCLMHSYIRGKAHASFLKAAAACLCAILDFACLPLWHQMVFCQIFCNKPWNS